MFNPVLLADQNDDLTENVNDAEKEDPEDQAVQGRVREKGIEELIVQNADGYADRNEKQAHSNEIGPGVTHEREPVGLYLPERRIRRSVGMPAASRPVPAYRLVTMMSIRSAGPLSDLLPSARTSILALLTPLSISDERAASARDSDRRLAWLTEPLWALA